MKVLFLSSLSTPMMNKFCDQLNKHLDAHFIFYEEAVTRPKWWLNFKRASKSTVLEKGVKISPGKYLNLRLNTYLKRINPDVLILGGFFIPSNWLAYVWAKNRGIKVIVFTEKLGYRAESDNSLKILHNKLFKKVTKFLYSNVDLIMAVNQVGVDCYVNEFGFSSNKVMKTQYPVDMSACLKHSYRNNTDSLTFLFPHRLIAKYNPVATIEWFRQILQQYPNVNLKMNGFGNLREILEELIEQNGLVENVKFIDGVSSWEELPDIYQSADVLLSTKSVKESISNFQNGLLTFFKYLNKETTSVTFLNDDKKDEILDRKNKELEDAIAYQTEVGDKLIDVSKGLENIGEIIFDFENGNNLQLGYAITCHSAQGSQWKTVIVGINYSMFFLLSREWLYTAITRASKH